MAAYTPYQPKWVAEAGTTGPRIAQAYPNQVASWRTGDILAAVTTGSVVTPSGGLSTLATAAAPSLGTNPVPFNLINSSSTTTQGVLTVSATTSSAAPVQTYYCVVTYTNSGFSTETPSSVPFIVNCAAGIVPVFNVSATGEPSGADHYSVYAGVTPGAFYQQHAVTATGSNTTLVYPLTNYYGLNKAAANANSLIFGVADSDSDAYFAGVLGATAGGSLNTGKRSLFGATQSYGPGWPNDPFALPVQKLQVGLLEMSLIQAYYPSVNGASVGLTIDSATGFFVADTSATATATVQDLSYYPGYSGGIGDTYARVTVKFTAGNLI